MKGFPLNTVKRNMHALVFVIGACLPIVLTTPAAAQDVQARINRLENELQTLNRAVFKGEEPPAGYNSVMSGSLNADAAAQANIELRLSQLENEMRHITGRLEEISFQNQQLQSRLEAEIAEMKRAIEEGDRSRMYDTPPAMGTRNGGNGSILGGRAMDDVPPIERDGPPQSFETPQPQNNQDANQNQLGVLRTTVDENGNVIDQDLPDDVWPTDPAGLYERAFSYLRERDYDRAEQGFAKFLQSYPDHDLAANSKYWLGETFYVRQQYDRAAREFAESYQKYPDGPKGPDNLLKLAMSLSGAGKTDDACLSLEQLAKQYPDAPSSITIRAEAEAEKMGCN